MIRSVRNTVEAEERNEKISDEKKFEAFKRRCVEENEKRYGKETREKYGDDEVNAAVRGGIGPDTDEGREIACLHKKWLTVSMKNYDAAKHRGIAELYTADERFTAYYDKNVS